MSVKKLLLALSLLSLSSHGATQIPIDPYKHIVLAGGCFWSMQRGMDTLLGKGIIRTSVGYSGGLKEKPTYEEVSTGETGHREAVEVTYDPKKIKLEEILATFWTHIDPLDNKGQFCDHADEYLSAIFYANDEEKRIIEKSRDVAQKKIKVKGTFVTNIFPAKIFYPAEAYHQNFYLVNKVKYNFYRLACGRDTRIEELWGKEK